MLLRRYALACCLLSCCFFAVQGQGIVEDNTLGYSIYLPENWVKSIRTDTHHVFYDQTDTYSSYLSVAKYSITDTVFKNPKDWARANALAYKLYLEYDWCDSSDCYPYGVVLHFDTTGVRKQATFSGDSSWACEIYMRFYSLDTVMYAWDEYIRYTAVGNHGYELYAVGDTVDMATNIGLYAAILTSIELQDEATHSISSRRLEGIRTRGLSLSRTGSTGTISFDATGRTRRILDKSMEMRAASGIYLKEARKTISRKN